MRNIFIFILSAFAIACSSNSDGGGSSGGSSNAATGPMSIARPACDGAACISSNSMMSVSPQSTASKDILLSYATDIYSNFYSQIVPGINQSIYGLEQAANANGLTTCNAIASTSIANSVDLGSGYSVDITNGSKTLPTHFVGAGTTTSRKFTIYKSSVAFAEVQIYCNSSTQTTVYVRAVEASKVYEFWAQKDTASDAIVIYGAFDEGTKKYSLFFKTTDGNAFEMHVAGINFVSGSTTVDFSMAGGVNLSANIADIAVAVGNGSTVIPSSLGAAQANNTSWSGTDIRHCYSALTSSTITTTAATCNGLLALTPSNSAIRQSVTSWSVNGINQTIPTAF